MEDAGIKEGDKIQVKLMDIDPRTGKFKLSRKVFPPERTEKSATRVRSNKRNIFKKRAFSVAFFCALKIISIK